MQRAAQKRVYEMQSRQRAALEQNRCARCAAHSEPARELPVEIPAAPEPACEPIPEPACEPAQQSDPELFLLMAVLALLVSENADPRLIAALLYII